VQFSGDNVWEKFRHEAGKHVVQRCPKNDRSGRVHTSIVSVAVMPLPPEQSERSLPLHEVEVTTQRGHGKGGQHQNTTDSAVRATHKSTGLSVFINGRDQYQNKKLALKILTNKVVLAKDKEAETLYGIERREQLGNGSRGSKIRTYNFLRRCVTDHRTGKKTHQLERVLQGEVGLVI